MAAGGFDDESAAVLNEDGVAVAAGLSFAADRDGGDERIGAAME